MRKSALFAFALVVAALVALGLVVLSSASEANGIRLHKDAYFFMKRQFIYLGIGIVIAVAAALFDYHGWRDIPGLAWLFYIAVAILLLFVFPQLGGREINGSFRWIKLGPVNVQPSEFAKLAIVIMLAVWLDRAAWRVELFVKGLVVPCCLVAVYALLVIKEPDFGSVMVIGARRLLAFLNSSQETAEKVTTANMDAAAYQAHMALVAIKNGGILGVGLGKSMQKQYYLPECHTDFIFAVGAEELGLFFSIAVVVLFLVFFCISVYIARNASDRFGRFLVIGMAFIVFFQAVFNLGVVCEALPTKGMALPFFSYGGTNLLSAFFAVGTILSVGIHSYRDKKRILARSVLTRV